MLNIVSDEMICLGFASNKGEVGEIQKRTLAMINNYDKNLLMEVFHHSIFMHA